MTITDDDNAPTLSIADKTISDETAVASNIVVTLASPSQQTITVDYATSNGTATAANDYVAANGTLTFAAGTTTKNIPVTMVQDAIDELNETFTVTCLILRTQQFQELPLQSQSQMMTLHHHWP